MSSPHRSSRPSRRRTSLNSSLSAEVRSPGLTSRLSSYIRASSLSPAARRAAEWEVLGKAEAGDEGANRPVVRPGYEGIGLRPRVVLHRPALPRLTERNTQRLGRRGPSRCTVKVAPARTFSPSFRPRPENEENSRPQKESPSPTSASSSTPAVVDPRRLVEVLKEMSARKRDRAQLLQEQQEAEEEEEEDGGSKRARRDSSSSVGSSFSMEMPPLFSNGVVGQVRLEIPSVRCTTVCRYVLPRCASVMMMMRHRSASSISDHLAAGEQGDGSVAQLPAQPQPRDLPHDPSSTLVRSGEAGACRACEWAQVLGGAACGNGREAQEEDHAQRDYVLPQLEHQHEEEERGEF